MDLPVPIGKAVCVNRRYGDSAIRFWITFPERLWLFVLFLAVIMRKSPRSLMDGIMDRIA